MTIAIVGSGAAGLSAAHCLQRCRDVLIYEQEPHAGGHVWTVEVPHEHDCGKSVAVDVGFQLYHQRHNPNLAALFRELGIEAEQVAFTLSSSFAGGVWTNNGQRTAFGVSIEAEIARFLRDLPRIAGLDQRVSLAELFASGGYSRDFRDHCLAPLMSFWWVSRSGLFEMPAFIVAAAILQGAVSFVGPTHWWAVSGGAHNYVARMLEPFADKILLGTAVRRIERSATGVVIYDNKGHRRSFEQVILATDASRALALLDAPTADERRLLGAIRFEPSTLLVHRDTTVMPAERALWCYGNFRSLGAAPASGGIAGEMTYWQPRVGGASVFVTVAAAASQIDERKVIARRSWRHRVIDTAILAHRLTPIQGVRRTWFCGAHTLGFPVHEHALCSGFAVAEALGAAYPFPDQPEAVRGYEAFKAGFF